VCCNCVCSLVNSAGGRNSSIQVMLRLPTGETVPYTMPTIVIMPQLTSTVAGILPSHSVTAVSSKPMQIMPDSYVAGLVSSLNQPSLSLNSHTSLGLPSVVSDETVGCQPVDVFDLPDSGLTALGIAASTREVDMIREL